MTGFLLTALFFTCGVLAFASIAATLRRHGPATLHLFRSNGECQNAPEVRWTVTLTQTRTADQAPATILRPNFGGDSGGRAKPRPRRAALRAAA